MEITAFVRNAAARHEVVVATDGKEQSSTASAEAIAERLRQTDAVAELQNTVRSDVPVVLESF